MKFQRRLSNGRWTDISDIAPLVAATVAMEVWYAPRVGRTPMDEQGVMAALSAGQEVRYGMDWYSQIRDADAVQHPPKPQPKAEIACSCGHTTAHPMMTSRGTACPDCYDRMSD